MLTDLGVKYVISRPQRAPRHGETDETSTQRSSLLLDGGLNPIICVGESLEQREHGHHRGVDRYAGQERPERRDR